ncbi:TPR-like protein [Athelia psychrophila]|uniref:TPR-like protein n=1 Tax=Athelia psychrophila TaxID=1759441 RepID=A0A166DHR6_9AGAM|nr:TPR-like protein [Fibularhizoctonia sp. CBS 109695]
MISVTSLDLQVVGDLIKESSCLLEDHFFTLYVNEKEVFKSQKKAREPPPRWKEQKPLIVIFRQSFLARVPGKKNMVAEFNGTVVDLLDNSAEHEMRTKSGVSVDWRISVRLDYSSESHAEFMKAVGEDISRIGKASGGDAAHAATTVTGHLGTVLEKIVPIVDKFAGTHPILYAAWTVLSSAYKVVQQQIITNSSVRDLVDKLHKVVGVASVCQNLPEIGGTINVLGDIGRAALEAALLIHEHAGPAVEEKPSIFARTAKHSPTIISSRIAQCQKQFDDLVAIFDRRIPLDIRSTVEALQDGQTKMVLDKLGDASQHLDANRSPLASENAASLSQMPAVVFNTSSTSGGKVTNVAGNYTVNGLEEIQLAMKMTLDRLLYAEGASWNPNMTCLPGTWATILSIIHAWARSLDGQNVLWLKGVAGSGKSAIAHTIAQSLHKDGRLASSFFFDRNVASRNTSHLLVTTIARDIAMIHPAIAADIRTTLEEDPSLASASLSRQFEVFLSGPLRRHPIEHSFVIVIDALDEIIHEDSTIELLKILRDEASKLPPQIRILVTSRPTRDIVDYLSKQSHIASHAIDIASVENGQDIEAYIDHQLRDPILHKRMGSRDSTEALVRDLTNLAGGLFIWIVTVFRYLRNADNPEGKLRALLAKTGTPGRLDPSKIMDALYTVILELCGDWQDPEFCEGYRMLMGAIVAAKRPLSLAALRALHGDTLMLSPGSLPQRFGSVLVGLDDDDGPVCVLHLSFQDFITDHTPTSSKFHIGAKEHSGRLAELCLQTMVRELEIAAAPIRGTGYILKDDDDEPGIPKVFGVSEQLLYCCEYWSDHVSDVEEQDTAISQAVQAFLPRHNTTLIEIVSSMSVFRGSLAVWRWLQVRAPEFKEQGHESQASTLISLSMCFKYAGRLEEALVASQEAVDLYRALAAERPVAFNADLAASLNNISNRLSALGRREEAVVASQEAVDVFRTLAAERPVVFNADLARSLANLSVCLSALGRREEALVTNQEAVDLYRALAAERPAVFNVNLAQSLNNISIWLSDLGRREEALVAVKQAVDLLRALAAERPVVFNAYLAMSLHTISNRLSDLGRREEALVTGQEAVDLRRALAAERPVVFNADLAMSLDDISVLFSTLGRHEEALVASQEAVDLYRALSAERPVVFNADLAMSLDKISNRLSALGRCEEALVASQEAVDLYRTLAAERLIVLNADLARSLANLSMRLSAVGRREEALVASQEAVDLYRALAAERPVVFNPALAQSLNNISSHLSHLGRREEALVTIHEAVDLRRALAAERPVVFNADLAMSLTTISIRLSALGRHEEALVTNQEAVDLCRALAAERPVVFNADLATSLSNQSMYLSDLGRHEEAAMAVKQAVNLYRALAAERPTVFNDVFAMSLKNLSRHLAALGRHQEAVVVVHELADLYHMLAAERPVFNANLTMTLNTLSCRLSDLNRHEEALAAITEALQIYRNLAAERTATFNFTLTCYLDTLSTCLSHLGRGEDALVAAQEAAVLCRTLETDSERPAGFNPSFYQFLINLSARLSYLDRWQEGLTAIHEASDFRRALAEEPPAVPDAELVKSVEQFSTFLLKAGHEDEAGLILLELSKLKML